MQTLNNLLAALGAFLCDNSGRRPVLLDAALHQGRSDAAISVAIGPRDRIAAGTQNDYFSLGHRSPEGWPVCQWSIYNLAFS